MIIGKKHKTLLFLIAAIVIAVLLWKNFTYSEPPFVIIGDKDVLRKIQVNVYMFRYQENSSLKTVFWNGKSYKINNQNVDRFEIYINYDKNLFYHYGYDNVPRMVNDESLSRNILLFCKIGDNVFMSNQSTKCDDLKNQVQLIPLDEEVKHELSDESEKINLKSKTDEENYIQELKKAFLDVTEPKNQ
ncbi:hypothetical protein [Burkholderia sp. LMG 32019]|uniref:hypothetical protein n=1 Tax=Burkholderia sp. LMG 32019 TaxID=3158173 RepID=UPI003C2FDB39